MQAFSNGLKLTLSTRPQLTLPPLPMSQAHRGVVRRESVAQTKKCKHAKSRLLVSEATAVGLRLYKEENYRGVD